jgi:hypothetical protein
MYNVELHGARRPRHDGAMSVGFWDLFFDSDYRQREHINALRDDNVATAGEIESVRAHAMRLQRQVGDLSVLVSVLVRLLEENGQLDAKVLRYRVEAELENIAAYRSQQGPMTMGQSLAGPPQASASPPEPVAPTTPTTCTKCGQTVPANRTTITEAGVVCDRCAG